MPIIKPILSNLRQPVITPEETQRMLAPDVVNIGSGVEGFSPDEFTRTNLDLAIQGGLRGLEESRAQSQTGGGLFLKGLGNILGTAAFEFLKTPGYIGGGINALGTGDFSSLVDNTWNDSIDWLQEKTQGKWAEVFTPPSTSEKGLMGQLSDPYFWASEGANGVGFLLSFMLPGQLIKAAGLGSKVTEGLAKAGKLEELVVDGQKMLQAGEAQTVLGRLLLKGAGKTGRALDFDKTARAIDSGSAIIANTFLEASAEAADSYDQLIQQGRSKEEAGQVASRVFGWNMALLAVSNTVLEKYFMSGFNRLAERSPLGKITSKMIAGEEQLVKAGVKDFAKQMTVKTPVAIAQEGLFEEGFQTTVQQTEGGSFTDVFNKYMSNMDDMFSDDPSPDALEFGKSVILGGALGAGMAGISSASDVGAENRYLLGSSRFTPTSVQKFFNYKEREETKGALELLRNAHKALKEDASALFTYDGEGKITGFTPGAKDKIKEAGAINMMTNYYNDVLLKNNGDTKAANKEFFDTVTQMSGSAGAGRMFLQMVRAPEGVSAEEALKFVQRRQDMDYFAKFLSMPDGTELLSAHMEDMLETVKNRHEKNTGLKLSEAKVSEIKAEMKANMEKAKSAYDTVNRDHSISRYRINPVSEDEKDPEGAKEEFLDFFARAKQARIEVLQLLKYYEDRATQLRPKTEDETLSEDERKAYKSDLTAYEKAIEEVQKKYKELSSASGLSELWKQHWKNKKPVLEEKKAAATAAQVPVVTREMFWDAVKGAGYKVSQDQNGDYRLDDEELIYLKDNKNNVFMMDAIKVGGGSKIRVRLVNDPSKGAVYNNFREVLKAIKNVSIIAKSEAANIREIGKQQAAANRRRMEAEALRKSIDDKTAATEKLIKTTKKEIGEIDKQLEDLSKQLAESKAEDPIAAKDMAKSVRKARRALTVKKSSLQDEIVILEDHLSMLKVYQELIKANEPIKPAIEQLAEEVAYEAEQQQYDQELLKDLGKVNELLAGTRQLISDLTDKLVDLENLEVALTRMIETHERIGQYFQREMTDAIKKKYQYTDSLGRTYNLPVAKIHLKVGDVNALEYSNANQIEKYLARWAAANKRSIDDVLREFDQDVLQLALSEEADAKRFKPNEHLLATKEQITLVKQQLEAANKEQSLLSLAKNLRLHDELSEELNERYKKTLSKMAKAKGSQEVPPSDGENTFDTANPDPFYRHALSAMIFESTGLNIEYNKDGNDLRRERGGIMVPVASPSPYQQQFFRWMDSADMGQFKAVAVTAYYDERDGELQKHFISNNETDQRSGEDIYIVIYDKDGNLVMGEKNLPLFTSVRRVDSKFPEDAAPKMSMRELMSYYAAEVYGATDPITQYSVTSNAKVSASHKKLMQGIAQTLGKKIEEIQEMSSRDFFDLVAQEATKWGRVRYASILEKIRTSPGGRMEVPVVGITPGHPVRFLNKKDEVMTFDPVEAFDLEFHENGSPKNFSLHKSNAFGTIMLGGKEVKGFYPGMLYIRLATGQMVPLKSDTLQNEEVRLVLHLLAGVADKGSLNVIVGKEDSESSILAEWSSTDVKYLYLAQGKRHFGLDESQHAMRVLPSPKERFSVMTMLMNWGWANKSRNGKYDIWIDRGKVHFGGSSVNLADVKRAYDTNDLTIIEPLIEFLKTKHLHVNFQMLDSQSSKVRPYMHPVLKNGKLVFEEVKEGYFKFMLSRLKTEAVPRKYLDKHNLPQFAQRNFQFGDPLTVFKPSEQPKESKRPTSQRQGTATTKPAPAALTGEEKANDLAQQMMAKAKRIKDMQDLHPQLKVLNTLADSMIAGLHSNALDSAMVKSVMEIFIKEGGSQKMIDDAKEAGKDSQKDKVILAGKSEEAQAAYYLFKAIKEFTFSYGEPTGPVSRPEPKVKEPAKTRKVGESTRKKRSEVKVTKPSSAAEPEESGNTDEVEESPALKEVGELEAEEQLQPKKRSGKSSKDKAEKKSRIDLNALRREAEQAEPPALPANEDMFDDKILSSPQQLEQLLQRGIIKKDNCS